MQENNCSFVCSRGILKSTTIHSNHPRSSNPEIDDYVQNCIHNKLYDTIYICTSAVRRLYSILNEIENPFILVSGDGDLTVVCDILSENEFNDFINNPKLIHWYAQNCIVNHPKLTRLPIGLDYHTIADNPGHCWGRHQSPIDQEKELFEIKRNSNIFYERTLLCYSNFHFFTTTKFGYDRIDAINRIDRNLVFYEPQKIERRPSWENQSKYAFVISPHGNGLDCHRTWEALALGCIPIVKKSDLDPLYEGLPVLIVDDWSQISSELLNHTIENFKKLHEDNCFKYEKLTLKYWVDKINSSR